MHDKELLRRSVLQEIMLLVAHAARSASRLQHAFAEDSQICKVHGLSPTALTAPRRYSRAPAPPIPRRRPALDGPVPPQVVPTPIDPIE